MYRLNIPIYRIFSIVILNMTFDVLVAVLYTATILWSVHGIAPELNEIEISFLPRATRGIHQK